jgi:hypothetical protein
MNVFTREAVYLAQKLNTRVGCSLLAKSDRCILYWTSSSLDV